MLKNFLTMVTILLFSFPLFSQSVENSSTADKVESSVVYPYYNTDSLKSWLIPFKFNERLTLLNKSVEAQKIIKKESVKQGKPKTGIASYYGKAFHGKKTASGKRFDMWKLTCASNVHPKGTILKVTNVENGKSVNVQVTDKGGFTKLGRILDLSAGAFQQISNLSKGLVKVTVEVIKD